MITRISRSVILSALVAAGMTACSDQGTVTDKPQKEQASKTTLAAPAKKLVPNDKSKLVGELQKDLKSIGYELDETGTYNEETKKAIKDFQAQQDEMAATGEYDSVTKKWLNKALDGNFKVKPGQGILKQNISDSPDKTITVHNPDDLLVLVNKNHALPKGYEPKNLVAPNVRFPFTEDLPKRYMQKRAADAMELMFKAADKDGLELFGQSGYRSYERQVSVFGNNVKNMGEKKANQVSARPGQSEHQTGLTMDITSANVQFRLDQDFGDTDEGKWVRKHAHKYGFIIRYPEGKEAITKYEYEPWHLRYVGKEAAKAIYEKDITFEEYLGATE